MGCRLVADNAQLTAAAILLGAGYSGETEAYAKAVEIMTWAIRQERDLVLAELVKLADSYAEDDGNGETYCREAMKRLLESWGHVRDE